MTNTPAFRAYFWAGTISILAQAAIICLFFGVERPWINVAAMAALGLTQLGELVLRTILENTYENH
jgi:hypothetical protein